MPRKETKPGVRHIRNGYGMDVAICGVRGSAGTGIFYASTPPVATCPACVTIRDDPARVVRRDAKWKLVVAGMRRAGRHPFNRLIR